MVAQFGETQVAAAYRERTSNCTHRGRIDGLAKLQSIQVIGKPVGRRSDLACRQSTAQNGRQRWQFAPNWSSRTKSRRAPSRHGTAPAKSRSPWSEAWHPAYRVDGRDHADDQGRVATRNEKNKTREWSVIYSTNAEITRPRLGICPALMPAPRLTISATPLRRHATGLPTWTATGQCRPLNQGWR